MGCRCSLSTPLCGGTGSRGWKQWEANLSALTTAYPRLCPVSGRAFCGMDDAAAASPCNLPNHVRLLALVDAGLMRRYWCIGGIAAPRFLVVFFVHLCGVSVLVRTSCLLLVGCCRVCCGSTDHGQRLYSLPVLPWGLCRGSRLWCHCSHCEAEEDCVGLQLGTGLI